MFRSHVMVCGGTGCTSSGSDKIAKAFEDEILATGLENEYLQEWLPFVTFLTAEEEKAFLSSVLRVPRAIPREWDNVHTYIALYALVIVNLF